MGVWCHYQPLPADGPLVARLRTDPSFAALYASVLHQPAGPFDFFRDPPDAAADGSQELEAVLTRALADHPGLDTRAAYLKLDDEFEARLAAVSGEVSQLVHGVEPLNPSDDGIELQWVPAAVVRERAWWLGWLKPLASDDHEHWRQMYLTAIDRNEGVVIG